MNFAFDRERFGRSIGFDAWKGIPTFRPKRFALSSTRSKSLSFRSFVDFSLELVDAHI
jgi:hypothetical protein